jgi:colanic acid/amylovoran biosynthesis protein
MTKVLLVNLHSTQNAGDAALMQVAVQQLLSAFPHSQVILAMNEPDERLAADNVRVLPSFTARIQQHIADNNVKWRIGALTVGTALSMLVVLWYRFFKRVPTWSPRHWRDLLEAYAEADLVVSCPGNIFATLGRVGLPFIVAAFTFYLGGLFGKPLYIMPQSFGPFRRSWEKCVVRWLLAKTRIVLVREPESLRLLQQIGVEANKTQLVPDVAFDLMPATRENASELLKGYGGLRPEQPRVGVTVLNRLLRSLGDNEWGQYETALAEALTCFSDDHNGIVYFFPQVTGPTEREDDRVGARRIASQMKAKASAIVIEENLTPAQLKAAYGEMDIFLATRLHSGIFAVGMFVPTMFLAYIHKTNGLAEILGLEAWVVDIRTVTTQVLCLRLEDLWRQRAAVRQHIKQHTTDLAERAAQAGQIIAKDFYG